MALPKLSLGCDPELFLKQAGAFHSAFGVVTGTKDKPTPLEKGAVQVDGMALEFNISPAENAQQFVENIGEVMKQIRSAINPDIEFDYSSTVHLTEDYLKQRQPAEVELGCDPDYNAWSGEVNPKPEQGRPMRTAGGHIHLGFGKDIVWTENMIEVGHKIIHLCDVFLGIPSVLVDPDVERRSMYGKAGAFRFKEYGVEYRSLSNFWIKTPELQTWAFNQAELAYMAFFEYDDIMKAISDYDVQEVINNSDKESAKAIVELLGIQLPKE